MRAHQLERPKAEISNRRLRAVGAGEVSGGRVQAHAVGCWFAPPSCQHGARGKEGIETPHVKA